MKKRISAWVITEKYAKLRSKLLLLGVTFTMWLNKKIDEEIEEKP